MGAWYRKSLYNVFMGRLRSIVVYVGSFYPHGVWSRLASLDPAILHVLFKIYMTSCSNSIHREQDAKSKTSQQSLWGCFTRSEEVTTSADWGLELLHQSTRLHYQVTSHRLHVHVTTLLRRSKIVTFHSSISPKYNNVQNNRHMVRYLRNILEYIVTLMREEYDIIKWDWFTTLSCEVISLNHIALRITVNYVTKRQPNHHPSWTVSHGA